MMECPRCGRPFERLETACPACDPGAERPTAPEAARRAVAAYLTGSADHAADVREAWDAVRGDDEYVRHLRSELGLGDEVSPCAVFREHAAAFSEMTDESRRRGAPELLAHVARCPACRQLLWELRPLWEPTEGVETLAEPIRLGVTPGGKLRDRGSGPPGVPAAFSASLAGVPDPEAVPTEWRLAIAEPPLFLRLRVGAGAGSRSAVGVWFEDEGGAQQSAAGARVDVSDARSGIGYFAGALADLPPGGIVLPPGVWQVEVQLPTATGERTWRLALELTAEADDDDATDE